jgi:hypothetical protein
MLNRFIHTQIRRSCNHAGKYIIYEVSIQFLNPLIREAYLNWLTSHHINEVLKCDGFLSASLLGDQHNTGVVVQYTVGSNKDYENYNSSAFAKGLRQEAIDKFGLESFIVTRRILLPYSQFFR